MYIKMLLNSIRIVKISYFRKAYWKEKQVCHFQIFHGNLKKYLPKKAVYKAEGDRIYDELAYKHFSSKEERKGEQTERYG